jgi:hypothetical protein
VYLETGVLLVRLRPYLHHQIEVVDDIVGDVAVVVEGVAEVLLIQSLRGVRVVTAATSFIVLEGDLLALAMVVAADPRVRVTVVGMSPHSADEALVAELHLPVRRLKK